MKLFTRPCFFFLLFFLSFYGADGQTFRRFAESEGAPVGTVIDMTQDRIGFIWLATSVGLYRYDSHRFRPYLHDPDNPRTIASNYVTAVHASSRNELWILTRDGLSIYDPSTDRFFNFLTRDFPFNHPLGQSKNSFFEDHSGRLHLATSRGLFLLSRSGDKVSCSPNILAPTNGSGQYIRRVTEDSKGTLWATTPTGLLRIRHNGKEKKLFRITDKKEALFLNELLPICAGPNDRIWVGGSNHGLWRFDPSTETFHAISDPDSRSKDGPFVISDIRCDNSGKLWMATLSGLVCLDPVTYAFRLYRNRKHDPASLPDNVLISLCPDRDGGLWLGAYNLGASYLNLRGFDFEPWAPQANDSEAMELGNGWMGTTTGGLIWAIPQSAKSVRFFDERTGRTSIRPLPFPSGALYSAFYLESEHLLWSADPSGLTRTELSSGRRSGYPFPQQNSGAFNGKPGFIAKDAQGALWVGRPSGLLRFDRSTGMFQLMEDFQGSGISFLDAAGNLWLTDYRTVYRVRGGKREKYPIAGPGIKKQPGTIWRFAEDSRHRIWVLTEEYLLLFDEKKQQLTPFPFPSLKNHMDMQADDQGFLWICNDTHLARFHPDKQTSQVYGSRDGLPADVIFRPQKSMKSAGGILYFPTTEGTIRIDPSRVRTKQTVSPLLVTDLRLFNRNVSAGDSTGILKKPVQASGEVVLQPSQNIFSIDFALLSYRRSYENRYAYKLEGVENDWNYVRTPTVTYSNLPAGRYTLLIRGANGDGFWNPDATRLSITILPPWWKSNLAWFTYFVVFAGSVYLLVRYFWIRSSLARETSLYQAKLDFFTNISHEIRTHLSLIAAPIEKAFQQTGDESHIRNYLSFARNNSERLMILVNELLDFRKMESGKIVLHVGEYNLVQQIRTTLGAFAHLSTEKHIATHLTAESDPVFVWFDAIQMQKVFFNLIGNAYKFTPEGGQVSVSIRSTGTSVLIHISDTGKGIAPEHLPHLFRNFYQVYDANYRNTGYGIGLALSREIVLQHGGSLSVTSNNSPDSPERGSSFTIRLPLGKGHFDAAFVRNEEDFSPEETHLPVPETGFYEEAGAETARYSILLIEDNEELRTFCREALRDTFDVLEAVDGLSGIRLAREHVPDLIVSDVMMPGMDGMEVCRLLRSDVATSHIPVILLTAKSAVPDIMKGLTAGADDYLTKPFHLGILTLKIRNQIRLREKQRDRYRHYAEGVLPVEAASPMEDQFLTRLRVLVRDNVSDQDFGVDKLARQAGISVSVLYRKLRALTGITVNDFVKTIRMNTALELLESGRYQVNEVALMVGFDDTRYFSREFRKVHGKAPAEVRRRTDQP